MGLKFRWFREALPSQQMALAMIGAKPGDRVVVIGAGDGRLAAAVALVTGLNGTTRVVDPRPGIGAVVDAAAAREGALLEFDAAPATRLADADGTADVVVLNQWFAALDGHARDGVCDEARRVLRSGGRLIVIDGVRRRWWGRRGRSAGSSAVIDTMRRAGFRTVRELADAEGVAFVEAFKTS